eukprot:TRINITY_DN8597_c0_g1_i1.p2 TRINITY_DN8597_c0_g1~~TRINITY_DN8597_c0_g1_i1.p2  ORF type:complete len:301 (-),score=50.51 TRINITY_DN8597_c0_g1_i1:2-904(-)
MEDMSKRDLIDRIQQLESSIDELKAHHGRMQEAIMEEEELIANRLLKKLSDERKEKGKIAVSAETEKEYITNQLNRRLKESQTETEHLQKQLSKMTHKRSISRSEQKSWENSSLPTTLPEALETITQLRMCCRKLFSCASDYEDQACCTEKELAKFKKENFLLTQKSLRQDAKVQEYASKAVNLQNTIDLEDERMFNTQASQHPGNYFPSTPPLHPSTSRISPIPSIPSLGFAPIAPSSSMSTSSTEDHIPPSPLALRLASGTRSRSFSSPQNGLPTFPISAPVTPMPVAMPSAERPPRS